MPTLASKWWDIHKTCACKHGGRQGWVSARVRFSGDAARLRGRRVEQGARSAGDDSAYAGSSARASAAAV